MFLSQSVSSCHAYSNAQELILCQIIHTASINILLHDSLPNLEMTSQTLLFTNFWKLKIFYVVVNNLFGFLVFCFNCGSRIF